MPWASETPIRASGTCRSPHSPRSWRTTSIVCIPDGWVQWLFDSSPPSVLHGIFPPSRAWPSATYAAPPPPDRVGVPGLRPAEHPHRRLAAIPRDVLRGHHDGVAAVVVQGALDGL